MNAKSKDHINARLKRMVQSLYLGMISGLDTKVVAAIFSYADYKSGYARPSIKTLARQTGSTRTRVRKSIARLELLGIVREAHASEADSRQKFSDQRIKGLVFEGGKPSDVSTPRTQPIENTNCTQSVSTSCPKEIQGVPINPLVNSSLNTGGAGGEASPSSGESHEVVNAYIRAELKSIGIWSKKADAITAVTLSRQDAEPEARKSAFDAIINELFEERAVGQVRNVRAIACKRFEAVFLDKVEVAMSEILKKKSWIQQQLIKQKHTASIRDILIEHASNALGSIPDVATQSKALARYSTHGRPAVWVHRLASKVACDVTGITPQDYATKFHFGGLQEHIVCALAALAGGEAKRAEAESDIHRERHEAAGPIACPSDGGE